MKFIEMSGRTLAAVIQDDELPGGDLKSINVTNDTVVRINEQGDIEVRRPQGWDVIGGLLGDYEQRIQAATGLDWA